MTMPSQMPVAHAWREMHIDIAFQPIFDLDAGGVCAYEALVRGAAGESAASVLSRVPGGLRTEFDVRVGMAAVGKAMRMGLGASGAALTINMTPATSLVAARTLLRMMEAMHDAGLAMHRMIFELTESAQLEDREARAVALAIRAHGFRLALDDFGAGYSGLVTLAQLPTDWVKLDMALIRHIDRDPARRLIVAKVVQMLRDLGREVVAEGIETPGELAAVRALGIAKVQGFLLGRPSRTELRARPGPLMRVA